MENILSHSIAVFLVVSILLIPIASAGSIYSKTSIFFKLRCAFITDQLECTGANCYWFDDSCHPFPISTSTEICYKLDEEVTYCESSNNDYLIIYTGGEIGAIIDI